jgi:MFS family permease
MRDNPNAVRLAIGVLLVGYGTNVSTPLLVLYRERLDLTNSATMAIFTVYVFGIIGTLLLAGPVSDRYGRRITCIPFIALSAISSLILILGRNSFPMLLFGRFLLGMTSGVVFGVGAAWMQELMGPGREQRAAVISTVAVYFGIGIGPLTSATFEQAGVDPLIWPFVLHASLTAAFIPMMLRVPETVVFPPERPTIRPQLGVPPIARRAFWWTVVPAAIWVFGFPSASFALFPVLISDAIPDFDIVVAAASATLTSVSALLASPVIHRIGARASIPVAMVAGTLGYVLGTAAFAWDLWGLVLPAAILLGAASGIITAASLGILGEMADPATRGALNSTVFLFAYLGMAMPIVLTTAGKTIGLTTALVTVTIVAGAFSVWAVVAWRRDFGRPYEKTQLAT